LKQELSVLLKLTMPSPAVSGCLQTGEWRMKVSSQYSIRYNYVNLYKIVHGSKLNDILCSI